MQASARKPYRGISMEGGLATWYAKITRKDLSEFERLARELAKDLPANARVLEIAPGPGYLSVALARLGPFRITGLDISQSFVQMASQYAKREGVVARFIHGSASDIPLEDGLFDLIVCRAAFKNFSEPLKAMNEMHRVLKPGRQGHDHRSSQGRFLERNRRLRGRAAHQPDEHLDDEIHVQAHAAEARVYGRTNDFAGGESDFKSCEIVKTAVGMEVTLSRQPLAEQAA